MASDPDSQAELDRVMIRLGRPEYRNDPSVGLRERAAQRAWTVTLLLSILAAAVLLAAYLAGA